MEFRIRSYNDLSRWHVALTSTNMGGGGISHEKSARGCFMVGLVACGYLVDGLGKPFRGSQVPLAMRDRCKDGSDGLLRLHWFFD